MDHVSDLFLETSMPLLVLIEAAKAGNEHQVEEFSQLFHDHANKLIEVSTVQHLSKYLGCVILLTWTGIHNDALVWNLTAC